MGRHRSGLESGAFESAIQSASISASNAMDQCHKQHSLSKMDNLVMTISGVTVEDTVTDVGKSVISQGASKIGVCYYENDAPSILYVHDNYPPGFDQHIVALSNKTLYSYEFIAETAEDRESANETDENMNVDIANKYDTKRQDGTVSDNLRNGIKLITNNLKN